MTPLPFFGKLLILAGLLLVAVGILVTAAPHVPLLGKLPGDFLFRRGNVTFYFPLATSLLLSLLLTILLSLFSRR